MATSCGNQIVLYRINSLLGNTLLELIIFLFVSLVIMMIIIAFVCCS